MRIMIIIIGIVLVAGCTAIHKNDVKEEVTKKQTLNMEDKWGIQVLGIRPTAAGHMLNFRYKIVDPEKAAALVNPRIKPYLMDQASGKMVAVPNMPKVGSLRQRSLEAKGGRTYFILFSNPRKFIQSGDKVTVVIGDLRVADLIVE